MHSRDSRTSSLSSTTSTWQRSRAPPTASVGVRVTRDNRLRSRRARRTMALVACVLWLAGFEVLPWMHIAFHDHIGPHHHDASGAIVRDDSVAHHEDDDHEVDEHVADALQTDRAANDDDLDAEVDEHCAPIQHGPHDTSTHGDHAADDQVRLANALTHGQHSLAHHDVAIHAPALPVTVPLPIDRRPTFVVAIAALDPVSPRPSRASARDPPVDSSGWSVH